MNAVKHAGYATTATVFRIATDSYDSESTKIANDLMAELAPTTAVETVLARCIAADAVRIKRVTELDDKVWTGPPRELDVDDLELREQIARMNNDVDTIEEFLQWLGQSNRDPLWGADRVHWKSVWLRHARAERFADLLCRRHPQALWPPRGFEWVSDWGAVRPQLWFQATRELVVVLFAASSEQLADWLVAEHECLTRDLWIAERTLAARRQESEYLRSREQLERLDALGRVRARVRPEQSLRDSLRTFHEERAKSNSPRSNETNPNATTPEVARPSRSPESGR